MENKHPNRLKELRINNGLTQTDLANAVGVTATTVLYWEQGRYRIDDEKLLILSRELGVEPDEIYLNEDEVNEMIANDTDKSLLLMDTYYRIARIADDTRLTEDDVDKIVTLLRKHISRNK